MPVFTTFMESQDSKEESSVQLQSPNPNRFKHHGFLGIFTNEMMELGDLSGQAGIQIDETLFL